LILCNGTVAIPSSDTFDKRPGELRRRITPLDD
jgi:hypothetical protein